MHTGLGPPLATLSTWFYTSFNSPVFPDTWWAPPVQRSVSLVFISLAQGCSVWHRISIKWMHEWMNDRSNEPEDSCSWAVVFGEPPWRRSRADFCLCSLSILVDYWNLVSPPVISQIFIVLKGLLNRKRARLVGKVTLIPSVFICSFFPGSVWPTIFFPFYWDIIKSQLFKVYISVNFLVYSPRCATITAF